MKSLFRGVLGRPSIGPWQGSATRRQRRSIRGYIEELERRVVLSPVIAPMSVMHAQTATLNGTTLKIIGDNTDDTINLAFVANGAGTEDDQVTVTLNGT